jgi:hypothetical protein
MIGGILTCLGVDLGEDSPGKQLSNPLGHFEDRGFLELNREIIKVAGGTWDKPPASHKIAESKEQFADEIAGLIRIKTDQHPHTLWGWKDPRTSLTIGLYVPYLKNPYILVCQRNPDQIAESLWKRNQFERKTSLDLTDIYQRRISDFLKANPHIPNLFLPYREIVQQPRQWIFSIADFLELTPSRNQIEKAVSFVLSKEEIHKKKSIFQIKYILSLPLRGFRKILKMVKEE